MHSPSRERDIFKFLIGLSLFTVVGFFNNCSGTKDMQLQSPTQVEMSSEAQPSNTQNQSVESVE
jgi:hypothetical protein